jgi:hypothetical protein
LPGRGRLAGSWTSSPFFHCTSASHRGQAFVWGLVSRPGTVLSVERCHRLC